MIEFCGAQQWEPTANKTLLAVSGGADSVAMAHLFHLAGFPFGIAHVNFKLRGEDSEADAQFVANLADKLGVPFFYQSMETKKLAAQEKMSIQMKARQFRYAWFEEVRKKNQYHWIATAHHMDDSIETFLFNLSGGCGIRGLHGIPEQNQHIIRPLSSFFRSEIEGLLQATGWTYRTDTSNRETKYSRNFIRHQVIPELEKLNPNFKVAAARTIQQLKEAEFLYHQAVSNLEKLHVRKSATGIYIDRMGLSNHPAKYSLLHEWTRPYGFSRSQQQQMLAPSTQTGSCFFSATHQLCIDRQFLILTEKAKADNLPSCIIIPEVTTTILPEGTLELKIRKGLPTALPVNTNKAYFDPEKIQFPLTLRHWQPGDRFQPFGMGGKSQKVKKYFTDNKVSQETRKSTWLLLSEKKICWIIGRRADHRFRVTDPDSKIIEATWKPGNPSGNPR